MLEFSVEDTKRVYYLSGPMSGLPEYNYPAFQRAVERLRGIGLEVYSPHECPPPTVSLEAEELWKHMMQKCMEVMDNCNAIIMLRGWVESRGAWVELMRAKEENWPVFLYLENPGRLVRMSRK